MVRLLFLSVLMIGLLNLLCASSIVYADCIDNDGDGYGDPASPDCTYPELDCNDAAASIFPNNANPYCDCEEPYPQGTVENCSDGLDNDCDGLIDSEDPDCGYTPGPANTAPYESRSSLAVSGVINESILLLIPVSAVILLHILRRKSQKSGTIL